MAHFPRRFAGDLIGGLGTLLDPDQALAATGRRLSDDEEFATAHIADMSNLDVAAGVIRTRVEIIRLIAIGILHNRLPDLAGALGFSFVAAMPAAVPHREVVQ